MPMCCGSRNLHRTESLFCLLCYSLDAVRLRRVHAAGRLQLQRRSSLFLANRKRKAPITVATFAASQEQSPPQGRNSFRRGHSFHQELWSAGWGAAQSRWLAWGEKPPASLHHATTTDNCPYSFRAGVTVIFTSWPSAVRKSINRPTEKLPAPISRQRRYLRLRYPENLPGFRLREAPLLVRRLIRNS
jgi:hypothetical protein